MVAHEVVRTSLTFSDSFQADRQTHCATTSDARAAVAVSRARAAAAQQAAKESGRELLPTNFGNKHPDLVQAAT